MILIGDTVNDERAETLVRVQIDGVELLGLESIVLESTVISDTSATYPGTPCSVLILYMILNRHDAKVQRMNQ